MTSETIWEEGKSFVPRISPVCIFSYESNVRSLTSNSNPTKILRQSPAKTPTQVLSVNPSQMGTLILNGIFFLVATNWVLTELSKQDGAEFKKPSCEAVRQGLGSL